MKSVQASAPGKVILFGEHAVVYGRPAIAVPVLDVQAQVSLVPAAAGQGVRIVAKDLDRAFDLAEADPDDPLALMIRLTLAHLGQIEVPDVILTITSTIPLGRGLGSGAAVSTAIGLALAAFFERTIPPAELSALVYEVEKRHHGTPSGIDNTVVVFARPVYFIKGRPIKRLQVGQSFTLVVGDTGRVAPTYTVVGDVRRRWQADRERYEGYFDEIGAIVQQARVAIEEGLPGPEAIGKLMNDNQELLETIGVSSPELDHLVAVACQAGALGAKLSGAGGGGNMIALARSDNGSDIARALWEAGATGVIVTEVR